jgi:hypothetical protein
LEQERRSDNQKAGKGSEDKKTKHGHRRKGTHENAHLDGHLRAGAFVNEIKAILLAELIKDARHAILDPPHLVFNLLSSFCRKLLECRWRSGLRLRMRARV